MLIPYIFNFFSEANSLFTWTKKHPLYDRRAIIKRVSPKKYYISV